MKKVIITGADGYVASRIIPHLETKYKLTLVDIDFNKTHNSETIKFDTTLPSFGCILGPYVLNIRATFIFKSYFLW